MDDDQLLFIFDTFICAECLSPEDGDAIFDMFAARMDGLRKLEKSERVIEWLRGMAYTLLEDCDDSEDDGSDPEELFTDNDVVYVIAITATAKCNGPELKEELEAFEDAMCEQLRMIMAKFGITHGEDDSISSSSSRPLSPEEENQFAEIMRRLSPGTQAGHS